MAVVVPVAVLVLLSACSSGSAEHGPVPVVTGAGSAWPWAEEFAEALASHPSAFERSVLEDGKITEDEVVEAHHRVRRCLRDVHLVIEYHDDGGFEVGGVDGGAPPYDIDRTNKLLRACEKRWDDSITYLYEQTRRNPHKQDEAQITVACLRKAGLVGKDYTERKWRADSDTGDWPYDDYDPRAVQCRLDPLGLWRDQ